MINEITDYPDAKYIVDIHIDYPNRHKWEFWKRARTLVAGKHYHIDRVNGIIRFRRGHMKKGVSYSFEYPWQKDNLPKDVWLVIHDLIETYG